MEFRVTRTSISLSWGKESPCEEAKKQGDAWFVEINTLEELLNFMDKYEKEIIISRDLDNPQIIEIEIYDTYRE